MFIVLLSFSDNKTQAGQHMNAHNEWLKHGFDEDVFILAGSIQPAKGGSILAHNISLSDLEDKVNEDPFVVANVVSAEIIEIAPAMADPRLDFLLTK
ncbi:YciI family protein [Marinomonas transparens]|uniref:YCII-related domain-containing protein n=1 Tax=Marinomonas transparens TaxID=2795388 RepID=A0A934JQ93_9GAMM|nr:hypothetical protein [Marinomonas transparens]MBJ7536256.1 hypothetical protein [Marinomonas transparens]